ncbi:thioredoxin trx1 [Sorochytrium milnesiophthora]
MSIIKVTDLKTFEEHINGDKLVVVDYFATWCGPCRMIAPKFEEFSTKYSNAVFLKVDVDEAAEIAEKQEVRAMPTFHVYKSSKRLEEIVGADASKLEAAIKAHL